jgi:hypothetical protein
MSRMKCENERMSQCENELAHSCGAGGHPARGYPCRTPAGVSLPCTKLSRTQEPKIIDDLMRLPRTECAFRLFYAK